MFFGDQPTTPYDLNFTLLGVPVRVHPFFWLLAVLLGPLKSEPKFMLMWVAVVFVSILVHEMGHAMVIRSFGWRPSILLYSFGGLAMYQARQQSPRKQMMISLAGPAAGFLLAALTVLLVTSLGFPNPVQTSPSNSPGGSWPLDVRHIWSIPNANLRELVGQVLEVNIWWGLMNLLPVWPLDGGQFCHELLNELRVPQALPKALLVSTVVAGAVAIYSAVRLEDYWLALMFGWLAYDSYSTLASFQGRGGGYGGRW